MASPSLNSLKVMGSPLTVATAFSPFIAGKSCPDANPRDANPTNPPKNPIDNKINRMLFDIQG
jgi:hypothetical protein